MTLNDFKAEIRAEFPEFKVLPKGESKLMKVIDVFLKVVTFGQMKTFMTGFITTLGYTVYVNTSWTSLEPTNQMVVLRHERVHMRQRKAYGSFWYSFLYLLVFFPVAFAYFRTRFEKEAYEETMKALLEFTPDTGTLTLKSQAFKDRMIGHFTSAEYFWMWPFRRSIERWYDKVVERLLLDAG